MYDHTLHRGRKHFCRYCLQGFRIAEKLKCHTKDEINGKQTIKMPKKVEYIKFINFERKVKSPFITYADFESTLVPENKGKKYLNESYTNKYQKHVTCSYAYELVCVDDKFSNVLKSYLGEDVVNSFISSMIEESKYYSGVIKKHFDKELVMIKEDNEDFEDSINFWISDNDHISY